MRSEVGGERGNSRGAEQGKMCSGKTALTLKEKRGFWNILIRSVNKADWGHEQARFEWCWLTGVNSKSKWRRGAGDGKRRPFFPVVTLQSGAEKGGSWWGSEIKGRFFCFVSI